ncbi:MAG: TA system VapC family ribonuclease toxin [Trueperaceae bacterium]
MTLVDANVLLHAVNAASPQHAPAKAWLDDALSSDARLGLPWLSLLAFIRIATHPSLFPRPLSVVQALEVVDLWRRAPNVVHPEPGRGFPETFTRMLRAGSAPGNLVNDAYLAALASEHDAAVATFDRDFARFPDVAIVVPGIRSDDAR